jgi:hypothetical protein
MPDGSCLESNLLSEVGGGALTFGLTSDDGETVLERSDAINIWLVGIRGIQCVHPANDRGQMIEPF